MKFTVALQLYGFFSIVSSYTFKLNPDSSFSSIWSPICDRCAPVEKLRATAFGIEIAPDYITLAMMHANGTRSEMLKVDARTEYRELMLAWMRGAGQESSLHSSLGLEVLMQRQHQTEIITDGLRQLLYETKHRYPGTKFEYGGIAMPDFIFRNDFTKSIVEKAINSTSLRNPKYAEHFLLYPTDFSLIGVAMASDINIYSEDEIFGFDALVVTNTSSFLSASWYQINLVQYSIGQTIGPKVDFPYLTKPYTLTPPTPENGKQTKAIQAEGKPDLDRIRTFVQEREEMYKQRKGAAGKRIMSGRSRLILRLDEASNAKVPTFVYELEKILEGTRFDFTSTELNVYRKDAKEWAKWAPAFHVALEMKDRVDSAYPPGCEVEDCVCDVFKLCVRQETIGNISFCEDTTQPKLTKLERVEKNVQDGAWDIWSWKFFDRVTDHLFDNLEARLWLQYCKDDMLWTSNSSAARCGKAIVDIGDDKQGVLEEHLGVVKSVIYAISRYWIDRRSLNAVLAVSVYWWGQEELLKVFVWVVNKVLRKESYEETVWFLEDFFESHPELL